MFTIIVGSYREHTRRGMRDAAQRAGAHCLFVSTVARALEVIRTLEEPPSALFVSFTCDIAGLVEELREHIGFYSLPVIALLPNPSSETFRVANQLGADDSIAEFDMGGMTRRLAHLEQGEPPRLPKADAGKALVAVSNERRRKTVGQKLRSAGYEVQFVSKNQAVEPRTNDSTPPAVLVTTPSFAPHRQSAASGELPQIPEVVLPSSSWSEVSRRELTDPEWAGRLMFLLDELTRGSEKDVRSSRRIQHSTICTFRAPRSFEPTFALIDNICRQGLYVRTMDPPPVGSAIRVDLRDHYGEVLSLRGTVIWRHAPSAVGGTISPGFGVSIDEDACSLPDLVKYRALYSSLLNELENLERPKAPRVSLSANVAFSDTSENPTGALF